MIDPKDYKREGYRLTDEGESLLSQWEDFGGCSCHTGHAPCSSCTHEGNPISLAESDEYWEPEGKPFDINISYGVKLDNLAALRALSRKQGETTDEFRERILGHKEDTDVSRTEIKKKGGKTKLTLNHAIPAKEITSREIYDKVVKAFVKAGAAISSGWGLLGNKKSYLRAGIKEDGVLVLGWCGVTTQHEIISVKDIDFGNEKEDNAPQGTSPWFGFKYRVNPETSKLLQEEVFKAGGEWSGGSSKVTRLEDKYLLVSENGYIARFLDIGGFSKRELPEKKIDIDPVTGKLVEVDDKGHITDDVKDVADTSVIQPGVYFNVKEMSYKEYSDVCQLIIDKADNNRSEEILKEGSNGVWYFVGWQENQGLQHWDSPHHYGKGGVEPKFLTYKDVFKGEVKPIYGLDMGKDDYPSMDSLVRPMTKEEWEARVECFKPKEESNIMSNNRRKVSVQLWDNGEGLDVSLALVAEYEAVTEGGDEEVIRQVLLEQDVKAAIDEHNKVRSGTVDDEILARTGNEVNLRPVKLKDLHWKVVSM